MVQLEPNSPKHAETEQEVEPRDEPAAIFSYRVFGAVTATVFVFLSLFFYTYATVGETLWNKMELLSGDVVYKAGKRVEEIKDFDAAIEYFRRALQGRFSKDETKRECILSLGALLYKQNRYAESVETYGQLPVDQFVEAGELTGYVSALWRTGQYEEAERLGRVWLGKAETSGDVQQCEWAHYTLGRVYEETARPDKAVSHYRQVVKLNPASQASINIAQILRRQGQNAEALRELDRFVSTPHSSDLDEKVEQLRSEIAEQMGPS